MKNIHQIRAAHAMESANAFNKGEEGDAVSGYPSLIINNGLLPTLAYSLDKKGGHLQTADAIASHLGKLSWAKVAFSGKKSDARGLRDILIEKDAQFLRLCTEEALGFLTYFKRFVHSKS